MTKQEAVINTYGCTPCPRCKSRYRWPTQQKTIMCDECGFVEPDSREEITDKASHD